MTALFDSKAFLKTLTSRPGIYRFLDPAQTVLYVGKARNLKKRLQSYFNATALKQPKTQALLAQTAEIAVTLTHTENEALILENTLIKTHKPHYNILLRDDKTYPYIHLSTHPDFPRLSLYRGTKRTSGRYFGPYPHARAARESLNLLQTLFSIRSCQDSVYRHRTRPCLQYQIKRCTAPCVGFIEATAYQAEVQHAVLFLEGKSQAVITALVNKMAQAAQVLAFEQAARYRDQIRQLRQLQTHQYMDTESGHLDVIAGVQQADKSCVHVLTVRDGRVLNGHSFFLKQAQNATLAALLTAFLPQYYLTPAREIPDEILVNQATPETTPLAAVIQQQQGRTVRIHTAVTGVKAKWMAMALENAQAALVQRYPPCYQTRWAALGYLLGLEVLPQRLECFDISHLRGEATVASCVVFDAQGPCYSAYRRFNIDNITPGDDYAAMRQALYRRYRCEDIAWPDILLIDGGKGQVAVANQVLSELQLTQICLMGITKGPGRKPSLDTLLLSGHEQPLTLPKDSPALHLLQHLRDEAHRFALTAHRKRRSKAQQRSVLEQIAGIGPRRRQTLLTYFGGLAGISRAGIEDLNQVPGIDQQLAQRIYDFFLDQ